MRVARLVYPDRSGVRAMKTLLRIAGYLLRTVTYGWLVDAADLLRRIWAAVKALKARESLPHPERETPIDCVTTGHPSLRRPDPCIYSQAYLMQQGLPVTWDNPDIVLKRGGVVVPEGQLDPNTTYEVEATIWNNSYDAPVVGMRVDFSFLSFGIATTSTPIGTAFVDVGVKGSVHHPGRVSVPWTTPVTPGHFCIQAQLQWVDDANPDNNMGQNNVNVVQAASPAQFAFPLRNPFSERHRFTLVADTYQLPGLDPCPETPRPAEPRVERLRHTIAKHRANIGIPAGWDVAISPREVEIDPDQQVTIQVSIDPPAGFVGAQPFNLNAFAAGAFAGGVTLVVTKI